MRSFAPSVLALSALGALSCSSSGGASGDTLPVYSATAPSGSGNWQPAPAGPGGPQTAESTELAPNVAGISWETSLAAAQTRAAAEGKPIFLLMTRPQCPNTTLWVETVLASPEMVATLAEHTIPLVLSLDVLNVEDLTARGGKPTLEGAALTENNLRLALKNAVSAASSRDPRQPPFLAVLDAAGKVMAADTGLRTGEETLALLEQGKVVNVPANLSAPTTVPPRTPAGRVLNAYQLDPFSDMDWLWATGNGAAGEAPNGAGMSNVPDPYTVSGKARGLAAFGLIYGGVGRTEVGQIVLSGGGTGHSTMNFTNPPLIVDWSNSGEGIQYYAPKIGPDVEDVVYANGQNFVSVLSSTSTDSISIVGCPPAHRWYNGTVRVGRHPMGVELGYTPDTSYAFVVSPTDGTIAAVYLDIPNGEKMGPRTGEVTYFDAASGQQLERRTSGQIIDTEGRGGGQTGFDQVPGEPGPVSAAGALLGAEDLALVQGNNWATAHTAFLLVSNTAGNSVSVFDVAPFLQGKTPHLLLAGVFSNIPNPRKLHWVGNQYVWVSNNPGNTITRLNIDTLPTLDPSKNQVIPVGKNPVHMRVVAAWWNQSFVVVANSGDNTVSIVKEDGTKVGTLDATNSPPFSEPYGVWASFDGLRFVVSNRSGEYATWFDVRRRLEGWKFESLQDVIVRSGQLHTGKGVTALSGNYIP